MARGGNGRDMKTHPAAELFPPMSEDEFQALKADIAANGLREPVWIILDDAPEHHKCYGDDDSRCDLIAGDGVWTCRKCDHNPALLEFSIIDGRHRWRACSELGIECETMEYTDDDPFGFVVSLNLHRRHLNESQRAMVAAKLATLPLGANQHTGSANLPTQSEAADMLGVSERSVRTARAVIKEAAPELARTVESGRVSVSAAADVATLPKQEQAEIVAKGEHEILQAAKQIRAARVEENRERRAAEKAAAMAIQPPAGKYRVIVIDPPWDMEKIVRDNRPNPVNFGFEYPTMTTAELAAFDVGGLADDACHLFCWTTQRFLPDALSLVNTWGFTYTLVMVWHKPGGYQPFGLPQYNAEFCVYARRGGPEFIDTKDFFVCFDAPRREHSRKPDEFYNVIRRVTAGPRIDVFSREPREGFDQFGNEAGKFAA